VLKLEVRERLGGVLRLGYTRASKMHLRGLEGFGRSGGSRKQMFQHKDSALDILSLTPIACKG
jgi:hypothetical protein